MSPVVYILECADQTLYTGWTINLKQRLQAHQAGRGAKYTRSRLPVRLVYVEPQPDRRTARQREWAIKQLSRNQKLKLVNQAS